MPVKLGNTMHANAVASGIYGASADKKYTIQDKPALVLVEDGFSCICRFIVEENDIKCMYFISFRRIQLVKG